MRHGVLYHKEGSLDVRVVMAIEVLFRHVREQIELHDGGVQDEDVEPTELLESIVDEALSIRKRGHVRLEGDRFGQSVGSSHPK